PRDEPAAESGSGQSGQEPEGPVPDGDGDGVPDTELTPARPLTSDDIEAEEEAEVAEDTDTETDVVESDPPDGRRPDIPKGADVGETVKLGAARGGATATAAPTRGPLPRPPCIPRSTACAPCSTPPVRSCPPTAWRSPGRPRTGPALAWSCPCR